MSRMCNRVAVARKLFIPEKSLSPTRDLSRYTKEQLMLATLAIRDTPLTSLSTKKLSPKDPSVKYMYGISQQPIVNSWYGLPIRGLDRSLPGLSVCSQDAILTLLYNAKIKSKPSSIGARHYSTGYPPYHMPQGPGGFPLPFKQENYEIHPGWQSIPDHFPFPQAQQSPGPYQPPPCMHRKAEPLNPSNRNRGY